MQLHPQTEIRHTFDESTNQWQYSVVDVIDQLIDTSDARNYWKVLKNRLKKSNPELVAACIQLKLPAADGKQYKTDVATSTALLRIINAIEPEKLSSFERLFGTLSHEASVVKPTEALPLSTDAKNTDGNLTFDLIERADVFLIRTEVAGIIPDHISLSVGCESVVIRGVRHNPHEKKNDATAHTRELSWGTFTKHIALPALVDVEKVSATLTRGLLTITLPKIDRTHFRSIPLQENCY